MCQRRPFQSIAHVQDLRVLSPECPKLPVSCFCHFYTRPTVDILLAGKCPVGKGKEKNK